MALSTTTLADDPEYWVDFGDGTIQDWQLLDPDNFDIDVAACGSICSPFNLVHTYEFSGFYNVKVIIKNLASIVELEQEVEVSVPVTINGDIDTFMQLQNTDEWSNENNPDTFLLSQELTFRAPTSGMLSAYLITSIPRLVKCIIMNP